MRVRSGPSPTNVTCSLGTGGGGWIQRAPAQECHCSCRLWCAPEGLRGPVGALTTAVRCPQRWSSMPNCVCVRGRRAGAQRGAVGLHRGAAPEAVWPQLPGLSNVRAAPVGATPVLCAGASWLLGRDASPTARPRYCRTHFTTPTHGPAPGFNTSTICAGASMRTTILRNAVLRSSTLSDGLSARVVEQNTYSKIFDFNLTAICAWVA